MATTRLNKNTRQQLLMLMLEKGMEEFEKQLSKDEAKLAIRAYNKLYTASERKKMYDLPVGWLSTRYDIQVSLRAGNAYTSLEFDTERRFQDQTERCSLVLEPDDPLGASIAEHIADKRDNREKRQQLKSQLRCVLHSVTTVKKLLEVWPEAAQFTEQLDLSEPQLPALPIDDLNKKLGLAA